jgi:tripartite-type tricarboxylate transporter receptor subunit TctC
MFPNVPVSLPHIKAGRLRALAVSTAKRSALFPELPTIAKSGLPGFEVTQWSGLLAPAGAPKAIIGKYQRDIAAALSLPDVRQKLVSQGFEAVGNTPGEFSAYIKAEIAKWAKVIREAGIHAD